MPAAKRREAADHEQDHPEEDPSEREVMWRQYSLHVDIYKFHVESTIKVNGFTFLVTGGVLGYVLKSGPEDRELTRLALLLPIMLSVGLAIVMAAATYSVEARKRDVDALREKLKLGSVLNQGLLQLITASFAVVHVAVALGLTALLLLPALRHRDDPPKPPVAKVSTAEVGVGHR